jgi:hypothetical protein
MPHAETPMDIPEELLLKRIVPLKQASELSSLSEDTLRRRYPEKIVKLSERRQGMRLGDALLLNSATAT